MQPGSILITKPYPFKIILFISYYVDATCLSFYPEKIPYDHFLSIH